MLRKVHFGISLLMMMTCLCVAEERAPFELIKSLLPDNPVIVEAGAHFGEDTIVMSQLWPQGHIYAFEPSPESYNELFKTVHTSSNVTTYPCALSDKKGQFLFYLAGGASSLRKPTKHFNDDYFHSDLDHPIVVEANTLDAWAQEQGVQKIDFIWFDMEGNELNAFKGALHQLKNVKLIYTEVNFQKFWEGCVLYSDLKSWLKENGFREIWIESVPNWHGNALFMNVNL
ncbi:MULTISPECIES: FkbM family methyltransferase [Parachlamydia]|jgi:FkbM family methyltransferase|uniref:Methyltransferase FkbM domain-containing protein n=1 Tax=Parachlamydia acanthamoebae (strain UV7) TaxID=765952 RepID=F8KYU2_PARAV|nr:FkbM family methyltransferase [Parachlamydia acanthamoebae]CCB86053.1 putative uncharacterized protein [Parachlamydia acanthamoebae UV-7]